MGAGGRGADRVALLSEPRDRRDRVAVVGAGPGGLCAARWLGAHGIAYDLLERNPRIGGIWDIDAPGSPMYESAHFISSKTLSGFRDFPMPESYPDYPGHRLILEYQRAYADRHGLATRIEHGVAVERAEPDGTIGWRLHLAGGDVRRYSGLVLALGRQWTPKLPPLAAEFAGEAIHSSAYRSSRQLAGRRVLVVGGGNSGCDIAVDAGLAASRALLSLRRGYWFIPKHVFGVPADVFGEKGPRLPAWLEQRVLERVLKLLLGELTRLGLPAPDHRLFETHPVLNSQILHSLAHGDVTVKPDVARFDGRTAVFADGSREDVDLVVFATGYRRLLPVLLPPEIHREGDVSELYLHVFHRRRPDLFVVGFFETDAGSFPLIDRQCELLARVLDARRRRPETAAAFARVAAGPTPDLRGGVRFLAVDRMANYVRSHPYAAALDRAIESMR